MIKKILKSYYKTLTRSLFLSLYGNVKISKSTGVLIEKTIIDNPYFKTYNSKPYFLYNIKNARIYTDNNENVAIIKNNLILPQVSFQQVNGKLTNAKYNSVIKRGTPSLIKNIKGKVFNLCQGASSNNYFHFLFDIIPKIYLISTKINLKKIDYFYISEPREWQIQILKVLGINKNKLISSKKHNHIFADEIFSVDHPWYDKGFVQHNVKKMPKWIVYKNRKVFLSKSKNKSKMKLFLDRSSSKYNHCQISNFDKINKLVVKKKIKSYQPENLSFKSQINLFKNSSIVIGAHGAALANITFCKPKTKVIEIIPSNHPNRQTERISKILKLRYFRIETKPTALDTNYPFKIFLEKKDLKLIEKIIDT